MLTKEDVFSFLKKAGIRHDDTVLIHTSLKSIGPIDGRADMLIDAFSEYLSDGLFLIPTHTWDKVVRETPFYDVLLTEPCIGTLPRIAYKREDGVRSLHPTHSIMAFGSRAREFVRGEEESASPAPPGGCWSRLYEEHAKILLIGVGHDKNTFFHAVDERLGIPNRLNLNPFTITIRDENQRIYQSPPFHTHYSKGLPCCCSEFYPNYKKPLEELGAVKYFRLGDAYVYCCDAAKCTDIIEGLWKHAEYDLCSEEREIPRDYYPV